MVIGAAILGLLCSPAPRFSRPVLRRPLWRDLQHALISYGQVKPSHFGLALHVGDVPVPLRLLALSPLGVRLRLGFLALLLRLGQSLLAQLAGQRPGEGQAAATRHVGQLFGTVGGGVGLVDVVEAVVVHLVEAVLQRQDGREAVAPLDLAADVRAPRLARHAWRRNAKVQGHVIAAASMSI